MRGFPPTDPSSDAVAVDEMAAGTPKAGAAQPGKVRPAPGIRDFLRRIGHRARLPSISPCANMAIQYNRIEGEVV
jgi:hypothetical protein